MAQKFATRILDVAIKKKKIEREELRLHLIEKILSILDRLSSEIPFDEAYIFGSITRPFRYAEGSDLDIGFVGLDNKHFFEVMSFISSEIGIDTDIVQMEGHRLAEKIKREGIRWKKKD